MASGCSSTKGSSVHGGTTPNKRLTSWAESRKLSVDTESIYAREEAKRRGVQQKNVKVAGPSQLVPCNEARANQAMATGSASDGSHDTRHDKPSRYFGRGPLGCFSFLMRCRCN